MDWSSALEALGGGASALLTLGAVYLYWQERKRAEGYLDLLMQRKDSDIRESTQRELAVQQGLEAVLRAVERSGSGQ